MADSSSLSVPEGRELWDKTRGRAAIMTVALHDRGQAILGGAAFHEMWHFDAGPPGTQSLRF